MNDKTHKIRRMLTVVALSAAGALLVVPMAQARTDDWFRSLAPESQATPTQPSNLQGDFMFRDYLRNAAKANDHILDVSARDTVQVASSAPNIGGDYMFRDYFRNVSKANDHILDVSARDTGAVQANDHILDVSARDARTAAPLTSEPGNGTDWQRIGIGIALTLGGALLIAALVAAGLEVRHNRHRPGTV